MNSNIINTIITVTITASIVGGGVYYWQNNQNTENTTNNEQIEVTQEAEATNLKTYLSQNYSFQYPEGYTVSEPSNEFKVLTIQKNSYSKIEIFKMKDFGDRPWGVEESATQKEIDGYIPKETLTVGTGDKTYDVWIYYNDNETQTKKELNEIIKSITLN